MVKIILLFNVSRTFCFMNYVGLLCNDSYKKLMMRRATAVQELIRHPRQFLGSQMTAVKHIQSEPNNRNSP